MSNITLALTTKLAPTRKFTVDGDEYEILGLDHLSKEDESKAVALFARHSVIATELDMTSNVEKGKELATRVRSTRLQIIATLTTLPKEIAEKLPLTEQIALITALQADQEETPEATGDTPGGDDD